MNIIIEYFKNHRKALINEIIVFVFLILMVIYFSSSMKKSSEENKLTIENLVGDVKYIRDEKESILENGSRVSCGGTFYTGKDSRATVVFREGKTVELLPDSIMEVNSRNSIAEVKEVGFTTAKSYTVTITKGEAIVDVSSVDDKGFFDLVTPEVKFSAGDSKIKIRRQEEYAVTYITVDRGNIEITTGLRTIKEGDSVYCKEGKCNKCNTMTLEKKDAFVFNLIESNREECYKIYSGDKLEESNISYNGTIVKAHDLEQAEKAYDILEEIYTRANEGETSINVKALTGDHITVHIIDNNNGILTFDPIDFDSIYLGVMIRL